MICPLTPRISSQLVKFYFTMNHKYRVEHSIFFIRDETIENILIVLYGNSKHSSIAGSRRLKNRENNLC